MSHIHVHDMAFVSCPPQVIHHTLVLCWNVHPSASSRNASIPTPTPLDPSALLTLRCAASSILSPAPSNYTSTASPPTLHRYHNRTDRTRISCYVTFTIIITIHDRIWTHPCVPFPLIVPHFPYSLSNSYHIHFLLSIASNLYSHHL